MYNKGNLMKYLFVGFIVVISVYIVYSRNKSSSYSIKETTGNVVLEDEFFRIPLSDVTDKMKKYNFDANSVNVVFFAVRGTDGEVRTAFDACDVCGGYKGYKQQGNDVVCNNCGRHFKLDDIGTLNGPGGCWPSFLGHTIEGDEVLIEKAEIEKGRFRFM